MATSTSYWCYRCSRFVRVWPEDSIVCPGCDGGFLEEIESPPPPARPFPPGELRHHHHPSDLRFRRRSRGPTGDRSPFNPVIVLRGGPSDVDRAAAIASSFEFYYDDGAGSGLRPLPASMSEFLMGSGFERLLDQLTQIEINGIGAGRSCEHAPASKSAVESMPTVSISDLHVSTDSQSHCAVCKEAFEIGAEAREMPCKHIYHQDCILPWLSIRNSCPVCRYEMPSDSGEREIDGGGEEAVAAVGLTIWRLPGGGFAVGRFTGGRRAGERELPAVYTEMDGGLGLGSGSGSGGQPRRVAWNERGGTSGSRRGGGGGGIGRAFRNLLLSFWRRRSSSSESSSAAAMTRRSTSSRVMRIHRGREAQILH